MFLDELKGRFRCPVAAAWPAVDVEPLDHTGITPETMTDAEQGTRPCFADLVVPDGPPEQLQRKVGDRDAADHPCDVGQNLTHRAHRSARLNRARDFGV